MDSIALVFGGIALINAIVFSVGAIRHLRGAIAVNARVTDLREIKDREGDVSFAPDFLIIDGPYEGATWASYSSSAPSSHQIGDLITASYSPKTGVIHSKKTRSGNRMIAIVSLLFAMLFFYVGLR